MIHHWDLEFIFFTENIEIGLEVRWQKSIFKYREALVSLVQK